MPDKRPESMGRDDGHKEAFSKIDDYLFVGSDECSPQFYSEHEKECKEMAIDVELSMTAERRDVPPEEVDAFVWIPVSDGHAPTQYQLDTGTDFINDAIENRKTVYVHCKNGHGRSPTMVSAYYVRFKDYSVEEAKALVKKRRPEIHIEESQTEALQKFAKRWSK